MHPIGNNRHKIFNLILKILEEDIGKTVNDSTYVDMLEIWLFPPLKGRSLQLHFPARWGTTPLGYRGSSELPRSSIGRSGPDDLMLHRWPPRSPDMTSCDFFLWGL
ncbi:hypothetical protein AVEN_238876-1 [Araneus ventricosus]|uniref:Uncharacterized protein n=1 Tax=Araneus ventricosus TaxID=182803 RepID=A0A4Y2IQU2_ARAVE|nr:hypothetical protein AVEN_238876-1 [Araneus ventricosus]